MKLNIIKDFCSKSKKQTMNNMKERVALWNHKMKTDRKFSDWYFDHEQMFIKMIELIRETYEYLDTGFQKNMYDEYTEQVEKVDIFIDTDFTHTTIINSKGDTKTTKNKFYNYLTPQDLSLLLYKTN